MARIQPLDPSTTQGEAQNLLNTVKAQIGATPNIFRTFAHSPAVLEFYLAQSQALAEGSLTPQLREQVAVAVAGVNGCNYCASAHTLLGKNAGVAEAELADNLQGRSGDKRTQAALDFTTTIVTKQGNISDDDLKAIRSAGYSEGEIVEIIAHVGMNLFTNYFNHIAGTDVDFPLVDVASLTSKAA